MIKVNNCSVKGCDRPVKVLKHQFCAAHALRFYRHNHPGGAQIGKRRLRNVYKEAVKT